MYCDEKMPVKDMIKKALLDLMAQKPYMEITVTDIIKQAEVARVSYYRNYNSIEEILDGIVADKVRDFDTRIRPLVTYGNDMDRWRVFLRIIFESKLAMKEKMNTTKDANKQFVFSKMDTVMQEKFQALGDGTARGKYNLPAKMGIVNSVSNIWLKTGAKESPDEMVNIVLELIMKL